MQTAEARQTVSIDDVEALLNLPFNDLIFRAQTVHRENFDPNRVQLSTLLSIKTGGCPEDCGYCPQAARYHSGVGNEPLLAGDGVGAAACAAQAGGAARFCLGPALGAAEGPRPPPGARPGAPAPGPRRRPVLP